MMLFGYFVGFFFFQAEDGIRDYKVTGVQTCALPISERTWRSRSTTSIAGIGADSSSWSSTFSGRGGAWRSAALSELGVRARPHRLQGLERILRHGDRKGTRLKSSHLVGTYAAFSFT